VDVEARRGDDKVAFASRWDRVRVTIRSEGNSWFHVHVDDTTLSVFVGSELIVSIPLEEQP
jgi:hypothetical protein